MVQGAIVQGIFVQVDSCPRRLLSTADFSPRRQLHVFLSKEELCFREGVKNIHPKIDREGGVPCLAKFLNLLFFELTQFSRIVVMFTSNSHKLVSCFVESDSHRALQIFSKTTIECLGPMLCFLDKAIAIRILQNQGSSTLARNPCCINWKLQSVHLKKYYLNLELWSNLIRYNYENQNI